MAELYSFGYWVMRQRKALDLTRAELAKRINCASETIKKILGRDPEMDLVYDLPHISITKENHFGKDVMVHRSNTSRAFFPPICPNEAIAAN